MIDACDQYVVFDHVQFESKSWQQRNRIKGSNGEILLTVPVRSDGTQQVRISEKRINHDQPWLRKHLRSIELSYQKAPYFGQYFHEIKSIMETKYELIADFNLALIECIIRQLGIRTEIKRSSTILLEDDSHLGKTERVVNLCEGANVTMLYDGAVAKDFLKLDAFREKGIEIVFQKYNPIVYRQLGKGFIPYLSVIDLLFNCGEESIEVIRSGSGR